MAGDLVWAACGSWEILAFALQLPQCHGNPRPASERNLLVCYGKVEQCTAVECKGASGPSAGFDPDLGTVQGLMTVPARKTHTTYGHRQ